jgi:hypothetical protein
MPLVLLYDHKVTSIATFAGAAFLPSLPAKG